MPICITVPGVPPSVNVGRSRHWTEAHAATAGYRSATKFFTRQALSEWEGEVWQLLGHQLRLIIRHYPDSLRGDAHNREKSVVDGVVDGLNAALDVSPEGLRDKRSFNDSRIAILSIHPERDRDQPRVEIELDIEEQFEFSWGSGT